MVMKRLAALTLALALSIAHGQSAPAAPPPVPGPVFAQIPASSLVALLPPPPPQTSSDVQEELKLLRRLQKSDPKQIAAAMADARELDIFVFRTVLGDKFSADALPLTAALSKQIHLDSDYWNASLKNIYRRPRPYRYDPTVKAICSMDHAYSYPSGHAMTGYLEAMMLAEMIPEQREAIFARADDYAHSRWICGAHYPSDTRMAHQIAATLFGVMLANPAFEEKLAAARIETRSHLGLPELPPEQ
jgi:acid phosphatase (class A)